MKRPLEFREVAPSPLARFESGTCSVRGRFHIIGGHLGEDLDVTTEHWAYDPKADRWDRCADQPDPVSHFTCKVQDDRYVWYTGGYAGKHPGYAVTNTRRYDALEDKWEEFAPLPELRASLGCAIFDNKMHVWGGLGEDRNTNFNDHWVLDLNNPTQWTKGPSMPRARGHFGTGIANGKAYAIGGHFYHDAPNQAKGQSCADLDDVHCYDPARDAWEEVRYLPMRRSHVETATVTYDGKIMILGGRNNSPDAVPRSMRNSPLLLPMRAFRKIKRRLMPADAYTTGMNGVDAITLYDPATDTWSDWGRLPLRLYACAAGIVGNQLIVTNGGKNGWKDPCDQTFLADLD